jgi:hypothetical protein
LQYKKVAAPWSCPNFNTVFLIECPKRGTPY